MAEETKSKAQQDFENKKGTSILYKIITTTYARHQDLTEEEFLKEIGFEGSGKTEDEAIRIGLCNLLIETTKQLFEIRNAVGYLNGIFNLLKDDEKEKN